MTRLVRFDPFSELDALQRQLLGENWLTPARTVSFPTTDVYTVDDRNMVVESHLPDFDDDDIDVHVENGSLVIQAEKHEKQENKNRKYVVRESSSSFYRKIQLPDRADANNVSAHMEDGVLRVTVPLTALPEPKRIQIASKTKSEKSGKK